MWKYMTRLTGVALAAACLSTVLQAEPACAGGVLSVDDLLDLAAFDQAEISPNGRWAIYEKRAGYASMPRTEFAGLSTWTIMDLWLVDLQAPEAPPQRLLPGEGLGLQRVAWSPSGDRLLINRLRDGVLEYGVVSMADRSVRWTALAQEMPVNGASAEWASDEEVVLLVRPDGSLPAALRYNRDSAGLRAEAWEQTAAGRNPSRTLIEASGGVLTTETPETVQALVRLDPATGVVRTLAGGRIADFALSPDGGSVAVVYRAEPIPLGAPELLHMEDDRRHRLSIIALDTGATTSAPPDRDIAPNLLRWSPDSRAVLVWARRDGSAWSEGGLVEVSPAGLRTFNLEGLTVGGSAQIVVGGVKADWLAGAPVVHAGGAGGERADWRLLSVTEPPRALTSALRTVPGRIAAAGRESLYLFADDGYWALTPTGLRRAAPATLTVRSAAIWDLFSGRRLKNEAPRREWSPGFGPDGETILLKDGAAPLRLGSGGGKDDRLVALSETVALVLHPVGLSETLLLKGEGGERGVDIVNPGLATSC